METLSIPYYNVCLFDTDKSKYEKFSKEYRKAASAMMLRISPILLYWRLSRRHLIPLKDIRDSRIELDGKILVSIVTGKTMQSICEAIGKEIWVL